MSKFYKLILVISTALIPVMIISMGSGFLAELTTIKKIAIVFLLAQAFYVSGGVRETKSAYRRVKYKLFRKIVSLRRLNIGARS